MKQMIALWSMVIVHGLMVVGPGMKLDLARCWGRDWAEAPGVYGRDNSM